MRPKKPTHVLIDQVQITREGNDAIIDHADANLSGARITGIATMTDAEIVEMYNQILDSQWSLLEAWDKTVVEEPPGEKQIDYHEDSDQWVPRGDVLRCIIDDGGPNGEVIIHIDDQELSLAESSAGCSRVHAGWGMRIAFVPEEFISENPTVKIRKPQAAEALTPRALFGDRATHTFTFGIAGSAKRAQLGSNGRPGRRDYSHYLDAIAEPRF